VTRRGLLLFSAMSVLWGIPYLFIRIAVSEISPASLVFARTTFATAILLPIALRRGGVRPVLARWAPLLAFAAIEIGLPWMMLGTAEQRVSSSLTGLLIAGVPLVSTVIALGLRSRYRLGFVQVVGLVLGIVGVGAIVGFDVQASNTAAFVELAVVVVCYAVGPVILARSLNDLPSAGVMAVALAACAVAFAPVGVLQRPHALPSPAVILSVAVLAVACTALAFVLFSALVAEIGPVRSTVITFVNPAVAAALGVAVLHETFTAGMAAGFVLVLLGSALATWRRAVRPGIPQEAARAHSSRPPAAS
jgi:drug/metabolite transporter (DMT)-like permease